MHVELIGMLRCPSGGHSLLVAAATLTRDRRVLEGTLGCPVCAAEYEIAGGVALFATQAVVARAAPPSEDAATRLAAFLELSDARGFALLSGSTGAHAGHVQRLSATPLVLVNPPHQASGFDVVAAIRTVDSLPFADGLARAAALDGSESPALAAAIVRVVRGGGRVTGPVHQPLPPELVEIARDHQDWVAERVAAPPPTIRLVEIARGRS